MAKQTRGRQKVDMKLIADESKRHVTFSKRRMGLFKKAAEINILTGAEVAAIVLSRHGKAYSFRTPGAKSFIDDSFVNRNHSPAPAPEDGSRREVELLVDALSRQEEEKERCEMEAKMMGDGSGDGLGFWWDRPIEGMEMGELERFQSRRLW
ncbi:agamous-like MADS-box protein AGL62 [Morus notabilis]|uniref:agamous-like MADS-box protein AGL62 n=1 Tax=Morus notabilis TaxID=981085 RepID=UPI000CED3F5E|nr:agamous-like MADS-box protein AGL62 [Morus notabilis]